ncbi:hypothetical protein [Enterovirga sp.]|jgi:hypothetical protein|uniref:hypothetical protein n=1 Tax=Enterovirga sp. TaxID=2026350 RepID=UPI002613890C|nr:hypothetical protein [Enterovirga sp.]MDB5590907.1 hypothetical protein [Enterovirga sp.]
MTERAEAGLASEGSPPGTARAARLLVGAAALCLVAAGSLLWWTQGSGVFVAMVTAGLAWCF